MLSCVSLMQFQMLHKQQSNTQRYEQQTSWVSNKQVWKFIIEHNSIQCGGKGVGS